MQTYIYVGYCVKELTNFRTRSHLQNRLYGGNPYFPVFSIIFVNMLPFVNKVLRTSKIQSHATICPVIQRGLTELVPNPLNRPTPLSINTLKSYAESQSNLPVRLAFARFLSSELPVRFAVCS